MKNKWRLIAIILFLILLVIGGYFGYVYIERKVLIQNVQLGYNEAIFQIFQLSQQCEKPIPITYNNQTINLINIGCLK